MFKGIIPAGAGKSQRKAWRPARQGDHPRGCGEKFELHLGKLDEAGSSPRVRGKAAGGRRYRVTGGIIPAGAGKSRKSSWRPPGSRDHPRGCGEKRNAARRWVVRLGSSPRVRGKASQPFPPPSSPGIIPAGAGKSRLGVGVRGWASDHPRGCGEKPVLARILRGGKGSSPRVRGKASCLQASLVRAGIIPAGAGKRESPALDGIPLSDHPRGCGEKARSNHSQNARVGSSPRVRGKGRPA